MSIATKSGKKKVYLDDEQKLEIALLYKDGASAIDLAKAYNIGESAVYRAVAAHGISRHRPTVSQGLKLAHMKKRGGMLAKAEKAPAETPPEEAPTPQAPAPVPFKPPRKLKYIPPYELRSEQIAEICEFYKLGMSSHQIADAFNVHLTTVYKVLDANNIGRQIPHRKHSPRKKLDVSIPLPSQHEVMPPLPPIEPPQRKSWLRRFVDRFVR